jgi:hypothetical protein
MVYSDNIKTLYSEYISFNRSDIIFIKKLIDPFEQLYRRNI